MIQNLIAGVFCVRCSRGACENTRCGAKLSPEKMEMNMSCNCGRSPTGKCVGWHKLDEDQYLEKKAAWDAKQAAKKDVA